MYNIVKKEMSNWKTEFVVVDVTVVEVNYLSDSANVNPSAKQKVTLSRGK